MKVISLCLLSRDERPMNATSWSGSRATTTTRTAPGSTPTCTWPWREPASTSPGAKLAEVKRPSCFFQWLPRLDEDVTAMKTRWLRRHCPKTAVMLSDCCILNMSALSQLLLSNCGHIHTSLLHGKTCRPANCCSTATETRYLAELYHRVWQCSFWLTRSSLT